MSRGQGRVYRPRVRGAETDVWWLDYSVRGERHRESSGTTSKREAQDRLRKLIGDRKAGTLVGRPDRVLLAEYATDAAGGGKQLVGGLQWLHETQYDIDGRRSKQRVQQCWAHLVAFFAADARAIDVTPSRLDEYAAARLQAGAARQTVNNELATLRRGFKLACEKGLLGALPVFKLPKVHNTRSGFFEEGDFAALLLELPAYLRPLVRFLRLTGWRLGEAIGLMWHQVDRDGQVIRIGSDQTKGGDSRTFPFAGAPELQELLETQYQAREGLYVFHHAGRGITTEGSFYKAWHAACRRAGLAGRLLHDLRRTAARDLRRAGVSEGEIMRLCGWKTRSMFDRYNIIDEQDLAQAVARRFANGKQRANNKAPTNPADSVS